MKQALDGRQRTSYCGEFATQHLNKKVVAMGWVAKKRDFGNLVFFDLRDKTGIIQVVFNRENFNHGFNIVDSVKNEYVICVEGEVVSRDSQAVNKKLKTGTIEIRGDKIDVLSKTDLNLPFSLEDALPSDYIRLAHRFLDLRRQHLQNNLAIRYNITKWTREYLDAHKFTEVETPFLGKSTPEGARDYLVPSRTFPNKFFALPQSPQLYKQLLMLAGVDRYFQIAKCFRDEDLRADRQPEFTQIDIEMSFVDQEKQVMELVEGLVKYVFEKTIGYKLPDKFKTLTYQQAMDKYGSDKPDTRFGLELVDISDIAKHCSLAAFKTAAESGGSVGLINCKNSLDKLMRKDLESLVTFAKEQGVNGLSYITNINGEIKSPLLKFFTSQQLNQIYARANFTHNDVLFLVADNHDKLVKTTLGRLRLHLANKLSLINHDVFDVLWVTDFPLFEFDKQENRYVAMHHPFTSPKLEDIEKLETNPESVRAKAYDIVVNGYELGGGSIRIHDYQMQEKMFKALGFSQQDIAKQFGFFVDAFKYGAPPHGGLAIGLDRFAMLLCKTTDIKDVIAFPKIQSAMDVMTKAPSEVSQKQLEELFIKLVEEKRQESK